MPRAVSSLGKWVVAIATVGFVGLVFRDAFRLRNIVLIDTIVVPKQLEDRGYTSQAAGERIRNEIDRIKKAANTIARVEDFAAPAEEELPDIQVPKTGLSYRAIVRVLQDALELQPPR